MSRLILLTRDCKNTEITEKKLKAYNLDCYIYPIATINNYDLPNINNITNNNIIITSFHAVKTIANPIEEFAKAKKVFVVGKKSAEFLKEINPISFKTASELLNDIKTKNYTGEYIYLRGNEIKINFKAELEKARKLCDDLVCYDVEYKKNLSEEVCNKIKLGLITDHLSFSRVNAEKFINLLNKKNLLSHAKEINIIALSSRIAEIFINSGFSNVTYPKLPIFEDMLKLCLESH